MHIEKFHITLSLSITNQFKYQEIHGQSSVIINKNRVCGILLVLSNSEIVDTTLTIPPIQSGHFYGWISINVKLKYY